MGNLYKYVGPGAIDKVFSHPNECRFKCSYPKDFNDPYELFLTVDFDQDPAVLAFYEDIVGDIPQLPTTCFSSAPDVTPMWAHYANNLEGIVVQVDEAKLASTCQKFSFGDVDYKDQADDQLSALLGHAHMTCKPRHTEWLQQGIFSAAYFTKNTCWSYERERRLVARQESVINESGVLLVQIPYDCISALIIGPRASGETAAKIVGLAEAIQCRCFEMRIGKSTSQPFFIDTDGVSHLHIAGEITKCEFSCESCGEPVQEGRDKCPWCSISQDDKEEAAQRNPMRILARFGMLKSYYESADRIRHRRDKGK